MPKQTTLAATPITTRTLPPKAWIATALTALLIWSYWPGLGELWAAWQRSSDYSGGQLVPFVCAYLVWSDRKNLAKLPMETCWWGLVLLAVSQLIRLGGLFLSYGFTHQYSMILAFAGGVLLLFGWPITWRLKWMLAFLLLMIPFPRRVHTAISLPLQGFATTSAVFGLELLGFLVAREGNVLRIGEQNSVAVAEACSGLRMLTAFIIVGAALALVVRRPAWQKAVLVASTIPVAILANTIRLTVTVILFDYIDAELAEKFFHDFAGILMMPLAVAALVGELRLFRWLSESPESAGKPVKPAKPGERPRIAVPQDA
ncbi:MAG TPA: exosortase/archaeosortase family protein [Phycisphaerae bacterium]|nr:exosortase/archaeosortase family protein [Phycisphaerae bacterium]HOJ74576.1 exosortase/archaeosortase family protein [Phycisphaerae bacterium]HOM50475.1 exosortase/archaeosortase family protein [Phycisphaerae bacterium]HOQ87580.1 exosortase/archaeosortase family protein [Phycisphaerae bacterium]HPP28248.1 exosortase/archaeosortase family protein [Phycisphaerae bacterium]